VSAFASLARELGARFGLGVDAPWPDFDDLALRVFEYQFETNPPYRAFVRGRGLSPDRVGSWRNIPPVPASAFKHLALVSGDPAKVQRVFRTSGTTGQGPSGRGAHHVLSLALYEAAAVPNLAAHLLPEGAPIRLLSLIADADRQPESSLSTMMAFARERLAAPGSATFMDPEHGVDGAGLFRALGEAERAGEPVWLAGTAFAFVHWLDEARARGWRVRLPAGSRLMETGGFKGRSREVPRVELYGELEHVLGIPTGRMVNEYGMTELLTQFYEPVLRNPSLVPPGDLRRRYHVGPPWVRTRVLDPETLEPCAPGETGLLCHFDLANLGSVSAVLTADLGQGVERGFRILGRAPGAEPRGCSLALEALLGEVRA
jgi:hypothetical protein